MRLTKQAQEVISEMISEKANAKIDQINAKIEAIEKRGKADFNERAEAFHSEVSKMADSFVAKVKTILAKHGLTHDTKEFCFGRFFDYHGDFTTSRVREVVVNVPSKADAAQLDKLWAERDAVNEKRRQADREIVLRASLNGDYDEVMKLVDGLTF